MIKVYIDAFVSEIPTPTIDNACLNLVPGCPIVTGQQYTYDVEVDADIPDFLSGIDTVIELALINSATNATIVCVRFPAHIN